MEVILLERIEKLGAIGDVVKVKNGYARNFLLPNGKALRANESNRKVFEANREKIEATNAERRGQAETESKKIDGAKIQLIRQASNAGQLYGSVTARDIAEALEAQGHKVAKNHIVLDRPPGYPFLAELAECEADVLAIEAAQPRLDVSVLEPIAGKTVIVGVHDLSDPAAETPEAVSSRIEDA